MSALILGGLAAAALLLPAPQPRVAQADFALRAAQLDVGNGQLVAKGIVLIQNGKITAVGADVVVPDGVALIDHPGVITAGLIACHSYDSVSSENHDGTRAVLDGLRIADAFEPSHGDFERALEAGITSVVLSPTPQNLVGGRSAVVKTSGGAVVDAEAHLVLSLSSDALVINRYPTSFQGAVAELEARFKDPSGAFAEAAAGDLPVLVHVGTRADVQRAAAFATRHGLKGAFLGAPANLEAQVNDVKRSGFGVVLGPYEVGASLAELKSAVELGEQQVPLGFALNAPWSHPEALRMSAALCVRAGLKPRAARRALTHGAAALAGVGERVGKLAPGLDADLVLWSGDPLDLTSSVVGVYVDGHLAYAANTSSQGAGH